MSNKDNDNAIQVQVLGTGLNHVARQIVVR
jgi:hypothetical protein